MNHKFPLVLILLAVLVSLPAASAWWDGDYTNRRAIQIITPPGDDWNAEMTIDLNNIDFSALTVLGDLNDVRIVHEASGTELERITEGTSTSTDGNISFRSNTHLTKNTTYNTTYYMYYNNAGAGNPLNWDDLNAFKTSIDDFEDNDINGFSSEPNWVPCSFCTASSGFPVDTSSTNAKHGTYSVLIEYSWQYDRHWGIEYNDLGYLEGDSIHAEVWIYTNDPNANENRFEIRAAEDPDHTVVGFNLTTGHDEIGEAATANCLGYAIRNVGLSPDADTWYKYEVTAWPAEPRCDFVIKNEDGTDINSFTISPDTCSGCSFPAQGYTAGRIILFSHGFEAHGESTEDPNGKTWFDLVTFEGAVHATGLGSQEPLSNNTPDVNILDIDGTSDTLPITLTYSSDGNATIGMEAFDVEQDDLNLSLWYGTSQGVKTNLIITDINLSSDVCLTDMNASSPNRCTWDWNIMEIADTNYFIVAELNDGTTSDNNYSEFADGISINALPSGQHEPFIFIEEWTGANGASWDANWVQITDSGDASTTDIQDNQGRMAAGDAAGEGTQRYDTDANWVSLLQFNDSIEITFNFISRTDTGSPDGTIFNMLVGTDANAQMLFIIGKGTASNSSSTGISFGSTLPVVSNDPEGKTVTANLWKIGDDIVRIKVYYDYVLQAQRDVPIGSNIFEDVFQIRYVNYNAGAGTSNEVRIDDLNITEASGIDANFIWYRKTILDPENGIAVSNYDLNTLSLVSGSVTIQDWNYTIDGNLVYNSAVDGNVNVDLNGPTEYQVCHGIHGIEGAINYYDEQCYNFRTAQYPQAVSFDVIPSQPGSDIDVNIDISYIDNNAIGSFSTGWADANYFSDFNNLIVQFDKSGTQNVCVTVADIEDLNKSYCEDIIVYGHLKIHFTDENTGINLQPQVLINDVNYSGNVDVNGLLSIDLNTSWPTATYTIQAYDDNGYSSRYWLLDLNANSDIDYNVTLLRTILGLPIDFTFYNPDMNILANATVRVNIRDTNIAMIRKTDAAGQVQLFLNPDDAGYSFQITPSDESTTYNYAVHTLTVKIPKDEKTVANVTPFDVYVAGIGSQSYTNISADIPVFIFSNTSNYYLIDVNSASYYPRRYLQKIQGPADSSTLQPFLVTAADGILPIFYIKDYLSGGGVPGIRVVVKKFITGEGLVEVQSDVSDIAGTIAFNFWANDVYFLSFYEDGTAIWEDEPIQPISGTYHFYIGTQTYTVISDAPPIIDVNFMPTTLYVLAHGDNNGFMDINVGINVSNGTISTFNIHVSIDTNALYDFNGTAGGTYNLPEIGIAGQSNASQIIVAVTITLISGEVFLQRRTYTIKTAIDLVIPDFYTQLTTIAPNELNVGENAERKLVTTFIALMFSLIVIGIAAKKTSTDYTALTIIFLAMMGLFTMIGWVIVELYALMFLIGIVLAIISRRF